MQTRARHEKMVAHRLQERTITTFLPLMTESRNRDRTLVISVEAIQRSLAVRVEGYEVEAP